MGRLYITEFSELPTSGILKEPCGATHVHEFTPAEAIEIELTGHAKFVELIADEDWHGLFCVYPKDGVTRDAPLFMAGERVQRNVNPRTKISVIGEP